MPPDGKYHIQLAEHPDVLVGAPDRVSRGTILPVVAGGPNNVWVVARLPGDIRKCTLTLDTTGTPWFSADSDNSIVVEDTVALNIWGIQGYGPYTIEVASEETRVWTLNETKTGSPVTFDTITQPLPSQLWRFVHLPDQ